MEIILWSPFIEYMRVIIFKVETKILSVDKQVKILRKLENGLEISNFAKKKCDLSSFSCSILSNNQEKLMDTNDKL